MKKHNKFLSELVYRYRKYTLKLKRLESSGKNLHRQHVLKKHITRLQEKLESILVNFKKGTAVAAISAAALLAAQESNSQTFCSQETSYSNDGTVLNALVDLDGDLDLDLVLFEISPIQVLHFENDGGYSTATTNPFGLVGIQNKPSFGDLDGDGDLDLITGKLFGGFYYFENVGDVNNPSFASATTNPFGLVAVGNGNTQPEFIDLDNDGDLDILVGDTNGDFYALTNTPVSDGMGGFDPSFSASSANPFNLSRLPESNAYPVAVDFDEDDDLDLLIRSSTGSIYYRENVGTISAPDFTGSYVSNPFSLPSGVGYESLAVGDIDGDGDDDIIYNDKLFIANVTGEPNNDPTVANGIADQLEQVSFSTTTIDLSSVFNDLDGDELTYEVASEDESVATVSLDGTNLTITEVASGTANISVTATDTKCGSVSDEFEFVINTPPVLSVGVDDRLDQVGFATVDIDISGVFSDADGNDLNISAESDDETVVTVSVSGTTLTMTEVSNGSATITLTADDGFGGTVSDEFVCVINASPAVASTLGDQEASKGFTSVDLDLSGLFSDPDNDEISLEANSDDETVVTVSLTGTTLTVTEVGLGTSAISVIAADGKGGQETHEFDFTVIQILGTDGLSRNGVKVYPNPASNEIMIESSSKGSVILYDLAGKTLKKGELNQRIELNELEPGVYLLEIHNMKGKTIIRLLKE